MVPARHAHAENLLQRPRRADAPEHAFPVQTEVGVMAGALVPRGGAWADGLELWEEVRGVFPFSLDAGVRVLGRVSLTADFTVAPGLIEARPSERAFCGEWAGLSEASCAVTRRTIGALLWLRPLGGRYRVEPVLGVGFAREWLRFARNVPDPGSPDPNVPPPAGPLRVHQTLTGWDPLRVRTGIELALERDWSAGAYALIDHGQFKEARSDFRLLTSGEISLRPHTWLGFGFGLRWAPRISRGRRQELKNSGRMALQ